MVYELKKYKSFNSLKEESASSTIAWETNAVMDDNDIHFCGKLLLHVSGKKTAVIPDGIETLGYKFLVPDYWGAWDSVTTTVRIPASVKKIEEGAFSDSYVDKILIDPNSPCGIIKDKGLFTKDGKTLLWILDYNNESDDNYEYIVADGVERIGIGFQNGDCFDVLVIPKSVTYIGFEADRAYMYDNLIIRAPKGSYAIKFAKKHNIEFEEID